MRGDDMQSRDYDTRNGLPVPFASCSETMRGNEVLSHQAKPDRRAGRGGAKPLRPTEPIRGYTPRYHKLRHTVSAVMSTYECRSTRV